MIDNFIKLYMSKPSAWPNTISLQSTRDQLDDKLNLRKKQLHVLFTALHQLQTSLESDAMHDSGALLVDLSDDSSNREPMANDSPQKALVDLTDDVVPEIMDCN